MPSKVVTEFKVLATKKTFIGFIPSLKIVWWKMSKGAVNSVLYVPFMIRKATLWRLETISFWRFFSDDEMSWQAAMDKMNKIAFDSRTLLVK